MKNIEKSVVKNTYYKFNKKRKTLRGATQSVKNKSILS